MLLQLFERTFRSWGGRALLSANLRLARSKPCLFMGQLRRKTIKRAAKHLTANISSCCFGLVAQWTECSEFHPTHGELFSCYRWDFSLFPSRSAAAEHWHLLWGILWADDPVGTCVCVQMTMTIFVCVWRDDHICACCQAGAGVRPASLQSSHSLGSTPKF